MVWDLVGELRPQDWRRLTEKTDAGTSRLFRIVSELAYLRWRLRNEGDAKFPTVPKIGGVFLNQEDHVSEPPPSKARNARYTLSTAPNPALDIVTCVNDQETILYTKPA